MAVSNVSGLAGIAFWINQYYRLPDEAKVDKRSELVAKIKVWVDEEYNKDRQTVISDEELVALVKQYAPELHAHYRRFRRED